MSANRDPLTRSCAASSSGSRSGLRNAVEKDRLDQGLRRLAARSVRHRDAFFPDPRAAAPGAVDAVQDLLLPVGQRQLAPVSGSGRVPGRVELLVLGVLAERLVDPARLALDLAGGHALLTSATRLRFIRPKL